VTRPCAYSRQLASWLAGAFLPSHAAHVALYLIGRSLQRGHFPIHFGHSFLLHGAGQRPTYERLQRVVEAMRITAARSCNSSVICSVVIMCCIT
jgi:hypothetical protein